MDELVVKYHCPSHSCPNKTGWCFVRHGRHYALIQTHFKMWAEAIKRGDDAVNLHTPPAAMRLLPVDAPRRAKPKAESVDLDPPSRQTQQPSPVSMGVGGGLGGGYGEALMPMLLLQQQMMFQQQQAVSGGYRGHPPPLLHTNYVAQAAEYAPSLPPPLPHPAPPLGAPPPLGGPPRRRSPPERPSSSSSHKGNRTTRLASSPVGSTGDRGSHLRLYIDWLKIQSPSLSGAFERAFHALNKEQYSLKTVKKWADKEVYWTRLDVPVGLGLQIADKDNLKDWWYREGHNALPEITAEETRAMALDALDSDETQR